MPASVADPRNIVIGSQVFCLFNGAKIISTTAIDLRLGITMATTTFAGTLREIQYPTGYSYTLELNRNVLRVGDIDVTDQIMQAFADENELPTFDFIIVRQSGGYRREYALTDCYPMGDISVISQRATAAVEQSLRFAVNGRVIPR
jgi:hypothetical protein